MERAAIYCRLSEEDRNKQSDGEDSGSIQNQKAMLLQYCANHGWEVFDFYSDDDYTGSDRNRPAFRRLLQDAETGKFDIVLCKTQSRFTRELELVEKYLHGLFPLWGVRFVSVVDNADTANRGNKKSRQINGLVNEWYLEDMSENIRSVLTSRRQSGLHIGAFALYGYQKDPRQKGHLIVDEPAAAIVREVFTLFAQGCGKTAIARLLNDRGVPNPTEYKRLQGLRYRQPGGKYSTLWKYSAIADMLENEIYIGHMVQGKYGSVSYKTKANRPRPRDQWFRVENTHEPIIDQALWEQVQSILRARARPHAGGTIGLFAGKARCAGCGYSLCSSKNHGKHYLQCPTRRVAKDACSGTFISVDKLEQLVLGELKELLRTLLDREELVRNLTLPDPLQTQRRLLERDAEAFRRRVDELTAALGELYLDRARGRLGEDEFFRLSDGFSREKARLEAQLLRGRQELASLEAQRGAEEPIEFLLRQYTEPERLTREMVELLIDHILIGKRPAGAKTPPIEIHWNF